MRRAEPAAASAAVLIGAMFLAVAAAGPPDAATPARPEEAPPGASARGKHSPHVQEPLLGTLRLRMGIKRLIYIYLPAVAADPDAYPVLYFSGDWGWRPLQQETASYLAGKGRAVVGFDASEYFSRQIGPADWAADLATLRSYVNDKIGKPPGTPVLLIGFTFGGELIPYILNRGGTGGFAGALLLSLDGDGAVIYRTSIQLKLPLPPEEVFRVGEELHRLPPSFPVFLMDGALDAQSALRSLADLPRGPHRSVTIEGADRNFRQSRDAHFSHVLRALAWLEGQHRGPGATTPDGPAPGATSPTPAPPDDSGSRAPGRALTPAGR
jgi:hypothetical protein